MICQHEGGCEEMPYYNYAGVKKPMFCFKHKIGKMVAVTKNRVCAADGCCVGANFNEEGLPPKFCKKHATEKMINVKLNYCRHKGCKKTPSFNEEGLPARFCRKHATDTMVLVKCKKCEHPNCSTQASFGYEDNKYLRCSKHKLENMVSFKNKCSFEGCTTYPSFGIKGGPFLTCFAHKLPEYISLTAIICQTEKCNTTASFGYEDDRKRISCCEHKTLDMINLQTIFCEIDNCDTIATCGYDSCIRCKYHSTPDMILLFRSCEVEKCNTSAAFGWKDGKKTRCKSHALEGMINLSSKYIDCEKCGRTVYKKKKDQVCCNDCDLIKKIKVKEKRVKKLLEDHNIPAINDKQFSNLHKVKFRPDFLINCNNYYIIIEVDEYAHKSHYKLKFKYSEEAEISRMEKIKMAFEKDVLFIRYNPDKKGVPIKIKEKTLLELLKTKLDKEYLDSYDTEYLFYD